MPLFEPLDLFEPLELLELLEPLEPLEPLEDRRLSSMLGDASGGSGM